MKPLTERQAKNCEEAREPVCRCRCGGVLHGAKRGGADAQASFFEALGDNDPHYIESAEVKAKKREERAEMKRREREEQQRRYWEARAKLDASRWQSSDTESEWQL